MLSHSVYYNPFENIHNLKMFYDWFSSENAMSFPCNFFLILRNDTTRQNDATRYFFVNSDARPENRITPPLNRLENEKMPEYKNNHIYIF